MACAAVCCAITETMCFREINKSATPRGSSSVDTGMSSSENECIGRDGGTGMRPISMKIFLVIQMKLSLVPMERKCPGRDRSNGPVSSFEKSEVSALSKRTRIAHGKSTVVDVSPAKRIQEFPNVSWWTAVNLCVLLVALSYP